VPVPVRSRPEFARIVGACREPVVVCTEIPGRPSFRELLSKVTSTTDDALRHRGLPFDQLVRAFNPDRDPRVPPLSDAALVYRGQPEATLTLAGAEVRPLTLDTTVVGADLTLTVDRVDPTVSGSLAVRSSMFERSSAQRVLDQFRTLLTGALADPDQPVDSLPLDEPRRIRAAVRDADCIDVGEPVTETVVERVHRIAAEQPEAPAVVLGAERLTYAELVRQAAALTAALPGVAGQAVAVRMPTGPRQVAALLGVLAAGAHLVCIGTGDNGQRVRAVLADVRPAALVLDGAPDAYDLIDWYRDELDGRVLDLAELQPTEALPSNNIGLDDRAYIAYTSGSTGRPKGIAQTHRGFAQFVDWWSGEFGITEGGRVAQWAAAGYDASLVEIFGALVAGATVCQVPEKIRANPEKVADWLGAERITLFQTVPSFARELGRAITIQKPALAGLDHLLLAGEALPGELADALRTALPHVRLINLYGPTESILATWHEITGPVRGPVPIGRPIPGRQVLVLDALDRPCPAGTIGQLVIRSPYIQPGYVGAAAPERSAFRPVDGLDEYRVHDGTCYRTGDFARRRWDGLLEFRGRGDFQVKFHGTRVELTDVEATLLTHESVAECAVVGVPNADGLVTRLVAYVVPRRDADGRAVAGAEVWRAHLRSWFGRSKLPVSFKTVIGLPRNLGGKVDRRRLPDPGSFVAASAHAPRTPVERVMATIWSELVGTAPQTTEDSFFAAGGHSLLVPQLLDRIRDRFGVAVSVREYVSHPTVAGLSGLVDDKLVSLSVTDKVMGEKT
jgi:(S)-beta-tyrosine adenylation enzyme